MGSGGNIELSDIPDTTKPEAKLEEKSLRPLRTGAGLFNRNVWVCVITVGFPSEPGIVKVSHTVVRTADVVGEPESELVTVGRGIIEMLPSDSTILNVLEGAFSLFVKVDAKETVLTEEYVIVCVESTVTSTIPVE